MGVSQAVRVSDVGCGPIARDVPVPFNSRSVKWARAVPRTRFSQGALYEIGSAMSLFQVKNYVDKFRARHLRVQQPPPR